MAPDATTDDALAALQSLNQRAAISGLIVQVPLPGAVVVDVGTNFVDGRLVGDVDTDSVVEVAAAVSPVPGGVGVLTNLMLIRNVLELTRRV